MTDARQALADLMPCSVWAYNKYRATLTKNGKRFALVTPDGRDALSDEKASELLAALNTAPEPDKWHRVEDEMPLRRAVQLLTMSMKWGLNGATCYDAALATNTGDEIRKFLEELEAK